MESPVCQDLHKMLQQSNYQLTLSFVSCFIFRCFITNSFGKEKKTSSASAFFKHIRIWTAEWQYLLEERFSTHRTWDKNHLSQFYDLRKKKISSALSANIFLILEFWLKHSSSMESFHYFLKTRHDFFFYILHIPIRSKDVLYISLCTYIYIYMIHINY